MCYSLHNTVCSTVALKELLIHIAASNTWRYFNSIVYPRGECWGTLISPCPYIHHSTHTPCTLGLCSSSFLFFQHLAGGTLSFLYIAPQIPHPPASFPDSSVCSSLPSLPHIYYYCIICISPIALYSLSLCEVIYLCACLLWALKSFIEIKARALGSDNPDFSSDELLWPWAVYETSVSPIIIMDKTGILILLPTLVFGGLICCFFLSAL